MHSAHDVFLCACFSTVLKGIQCQIEGKKVEGLCSHVARERLILRAHSACRQSAGHNSSSCSIQQYDHTHTAQALRCLAPALAQTGPALITVDESFFNLADEWGADAEIQHHFICVKFLQNNKCVCPSCGNVLPRNQLYSWCCCSSALTVLHTLSVHVRKMRCCYTSCLHHGLLGFMLWCWLSATNTLLLDPRDVMADVMRPVKGFIHPLSHICSDLRGFFFVKLTVHSLSVSSLLSISKFDERSAFLYVLHNAEDFQIYFCTEMHCKRSVCVCVSLCICST